MIHKIDGLNVIETGAENKQAILFIHAFPLSHKMWLEQAKNFSNKYRVITYDMRGFGDSYEENGIYTIDSHADDLFTIIDRLKVVKPIVIGLSMGGYILLRAVDRDQNKFKAVVLCDTRTEADTNEGKLNRAKQIKQIRTGGKTEFIETFLENTFSDTTLKDPAKQPVVQFMKNIMTEQKDTAMAGTLLTLSARTDQTASLEKINIPMLIIVGEKDKLTPPELSKVMYQKIRNSKLSLIPESGHFSNVENPQAFNKSVEDFINTLNDRKDSKSG
jgi:pimeloyl-ACP methyl ester carboxylesterase